MLPGRRAKDIDADDVALGSDAAAIRRSFAERLFLAVATFPGLAAFVVLLVALAGLASSSTGSGAKGRQGRSFYSPDGRRVVRLSLQMADDRTLEKLGLDRVTRDHLRALGPSLLVEFSRVHGDREIPVRSFTGSGGTGEKARYRVLWDDQSRRFLVLCSEAPRPSASRPSVPPLWRTGESVVFFFDRTTERFPQVQKFVDADWEGVPLSGPSEGVSVPAVPFDLSAPAPAPESPQTGEIRFPIFRAPTKDRILNFTIHPNTQNLRAGEKGLFAMPPVRSSSPSPDGSFTAKLAGERDLMVLLAEGDRYRDELWVLLFQFRLSNRAVTAPSGADHRLLWSRDSRHLLIVTRDAPVRGLDLLPDGTSIYLLFDTLEWGGVLGPRREELAGIDFPGLTATRGTTVTR